MKRLAPFFVLTAGILWGVIGIFVRRLDACSLNAMDIVAIRAMVTAVMLFFGLLVYKRGMLKIRIQDIWCFIGTGICSIVFFNYCYFKAMVLTSLSVAAVLLYTAPVIVMLLSAVLFQERITGVKLVAVFATFIGCVLVTGVLGNSGMGISGGLNASGILIGLGAGLGYALYSIFSRFALKRGYHSLTISFYTFLFATAGTLPLASFSKIVQVGRQPGMLLLYLVFGLVSTVLPYILYTLGLTGMENGRASVIASIEPVAATLVGAILFHEKMTINGGIGILLVLGAIVICNLPHGEGAAKTVIGSREKG